MLKKILVLATTLMVLPGAAAAADIAAGEARAKGVCAGCHGANGMSNGPLYPNLAGQKEQYLVKSVKAYRDGTRNDPIMKGMAAGLSDDDIANVAAYFAGLPCK